MSSLRVAVDHAPEASPVEVRVLRVLGRGRAAEARLVVARLPNGETIQCVEKVFRPGWLTRTIYRTAFQAPFAYQTNRDAILACFYRRRVAAALVGANESRVRVAKPLYVRWDHTAAAWVLAAEWIDGCGPIPDPLETTAAKERRGDLPSLLSAMRSLESLFLESGLIGTGWQVCPPALVSTANLLWDGHQWVAIDLESGIPAVLVPRYLWRGIRSGSFPMFDDIDVDKLRNWLAHSNHRAQLRSISLDSLKRDVEQLIHHTERWKLSEPAVFRRQSRAGFGGRFREVCIERWHVANEIDDATEQELRAGRRRLTLLWLAGWTPSCIGRRWLGHSRFRQQFRRFFAERRFRRIVLNHNRWKRTAAWTKTGRIPADRRRPIATHFWLFWLHTCLSRMLPAKLHRWLSDRVVRRQSCERTLLLLTSGRYQTEFARHLASSTINDWRSSRRLSEEEAASLHRQLDGDEIREYLHGFGWHLGLKCLTPFILPMKVGGVVLWWETGDARFLLAWLLLPLLRTAVTLWRVFASRRRRVAFGEALIVGALPTVGSLAYPLQMYSTQPLLSRFLLRDAAARLARRLPVYGGKDSRVEFLAIRIADGVLRVVEILMKPLRWLRRLMPARRVAAASPESLPDLSTRWNQLVAKHVSVLKRHDENADDSSSATRRTAA